MLLVFTWRQLASKAANNKVLAELPLGSAADRLLNTLLYLIIRGTSLNFMWKILQSWLPCCLIFRIISIHSVTRM